MSNESTQLTVPQRAEKALAFAETRTKLVDMVAGSKNIVEITNGDGYKECHAARMALKNTRIEIQKRGKEAREDAVKLQKAIIAKEKELVDLIEPEEARLQELQDAVDEAKAREKAEKDRLERGRVEALHARFTAIKTLPLGAVNATVERIDEIIGEAEAIDPATFPDDMQAAAKFERSVAIASLRAARDARVAEDSKAAKIKADLEELERLRAQQAAQQAEADRLAAAERERQAAEARRLEEQARAEREAAENAARAAREAEQARIDAERAEARRKEDAERAEAADKLRREQAEAAAERARLESEKAAAAQAARDTAIASATLLTAAVDAVAFLRAKGFGDELVTQKLDAAIRRDAPEQVAA